MTGPVATSEGIEIIKIAPKKTECPHCQFLHDTFNLNNDSTEREYYLMTEVFVYLHGGDVCNWSDTTKRKQTSDYPETGTFKMM